MRRDRPAILAAEIAGGLAVLYLRNSVAVKNN